MPRRWRFQSPVISLPRSSPFSNGSSSLETALQSLEFQQHAITENTESGSQAQQCRHQDSSIHYCPNPNENTHLGLHHTLFCPHRPSREPNRERWYFAVLNNTAIAGRRRMANGEIRPAGPTPAIRPLGQCTFWPQRTATSPASATFISLQSGQGVAEFSQLSIICLSGIRPLGRSTASYRDPCAWGNVRLGRKWPSPEPGSRPNFLPPMHNLHQHRAGSAPRIVAIGQPSKFDIAPRSFPCRTSKPPTRKGGRLAGPADGGRRSRGIGFPSRFYREG